MSDKKTCVLEAALVDGARHSDPMTTPEVSQAPCALLAADVVPPRPAKPAPVEDESADPVGDGHSDAEWAATHSDEGGAKP